MKTDPIYKGKTMKYVVKISLYAPAGVDPYQIASHCADACANWGGQYHPDSALFSANVEADAACRGIKVTTVAEDEPEV